MNIHNMLVINTIPKESIDRIFRKIKIDGNGCWNWCGSLNRGYGEVRINNKLYRIHRLMYAWLVTSIPSGKGRDIPVLDHICNNRACCNPAHLRLASDTENILRGNGATARKARQIYCKNGHLLPDPIRGHRRCLICHRAWNRRNYSKNPEFFRSKVREHRLRLLNTL